MADWFKLRKPATTIEAFLLGTLCVAAVYVAWLFVTWGEAESRIVGPYTLPSPSETFTALKTLWTEFELTRNLLVTLRRVALGFGLAMLVGIPLGIIAGCFPRIEAFLQPAIMFGRNIPLAAVLPLMIFIFGTGERNKVMFIFVAAVAFIVSDAARAITDVAARYIDTAYTLGASRWQTITKVLVPLAAPTIFSSCRQLFGLAFGYIMLAESIKEAGEAGGLGYQIMISQRRGLRENIYLIILIIPLVALIIDQILYWIQRQLFPHLSGSDGFLRDCVRGAMHLWEDATPFLRSRRELGLAANSAATATSPTEQPPPNSATAAAAPSPSEEKSR